MAVNQAEYSAGKVHVNGKHQGRKIKELYYDGRRWRVKWRECYSITDIEYEEVGQVHDCLLATFRSWKFNSQRRRKRKDGGDATCKLTNNN